MEEEDDCCSGIVTPPNSPFFHICWGIGNEIISLPYEIISLPEDFEDIITINVAGELFQTYSKTLNTYPDTLLGSHQRRNKYVAQNGELFFDRQVEVFECILHYYQSKGELYHPTEISVQRFLEEMEFFELGKSVINQFEIENGLKVADKDIVLPSCKPNHDLWKFLEYPDTSKSARIFANLTVFVIIISLIMFVIETIPGFQTTTLKNSSFIEHYNNSNGHLHINNKHQSWIFIVNVIVMVWFTTEFMLRFITCPTKLKFFSDTGNLIDLFSILPYYMTMIPTLQKSRLLSVGRVVRVFRVLKLSRYSRSLQILGKTMVAAKEELFILGLFVMIKVLLCGSIVYYAEFKANGDMFRSIPHAFWWAIVSLTSTGYGDMVPITPFGKLAGTMTVCCSILILVLSVPSVVSHFTYFSEMENKRLQAMRNKKQKRLENEL